jgi:hypothetical protein
MSRDSDLGRNEGDGLSPKSFGLIDRGGGRLT